MRQPARPDLWEARVGQPPGPTRQAWSTSELRSLARPSAATKLDRRERRSVGVSG